MIFFIIENTPSCNIQLPFRQSFVKAPSCCLFLKGYGLKDGEYSTKSGEIMVDDVVEFVVVFLSHKWY